MRGGDKPSKVEVAVQDHNATDKPDGKQPRSNLAVRTGHAAPGSPQRASDASTATSGPHGGASEDEAQPGSGGSGDKDVLGSSPLRRRMFSDSARGEDARALYNFTS